MPLTSQQLKLFPNSVIFQTDAIKENIDVFFQDETLWLTQKKVLELFKTFSQNIALHLKDIFTEGEIYEDLSRKDFLQTQKDVINESSCKNSEKSIYISEKINRVIL